MSPPGEWRRGEYSISTNPSRLDRPAIREFLASSYWSPEIPQDVVDRAIEGSLSFGLYEGRKQIGFARAVTDRATFAYVADVYVLEEYRERGLARWLMETVLAHPDLQGLRRWMLITRDAHSLYRGVGFADAARPDRIMEIARPDIYREKK
ncbi:MAG: GNAT family N-acetyltransferase [Acidobacteriota bacterium]|nr:GNAT family N-acetyltransferase [Acidobacteriota bacterium]